MKYSLTFLYSLLLKDGYKVKNFVKLNDSYYEITVEHPFKGSQWIINLDPNEEDSMRNVMYQISSYLPDDTAIGNLFNLSYGPIVTHGKIK